MVKRKYREWQPHLIGGAQVNPFSIFRYAAGATLDTQRKVQTVLEVTGRELGWQVYRTSHTVHPAELEAGKAAEAGEKGTGGWSELPSGLILQGYLKEKIRTAGGNNLSEIIKA